MKLQGRVAVVTGAGTGIGRGIALRFGAEGAWVVVNYRASEREAGEVVEAIRTAGGKAIAMAADVADDAAVRAMFRRVEEECGRLDVLVNNAGWSQRVPHDDMEALTGDIWNRVMDTNFRGAFQTTRAALPLLRRQVGASIINIASIGAYAGEGSSTVYAASKAAMLCMTKSHARAFAPDVRVNAICPGLVKTRFAGWPDETFTSRAEITPMKRLATPEDIAAAAVYLAADATATTGEILNVDGGIASLGRLG